MTTSQIWHGHRKCAVNGAKIPKGNQKMGEPCPFCGNTMGEYLPDPKPPASAGASPTERLARIEQLHAGGVLTDEECAEKRK